MSRVLQFRRGTNQEMESITGAEGELFVDLTQKTIRVHDGNTQGGVVIATTIDLSQSVTNAESFAETVANAAYSNAVAEAETLANDAFTNAVAYVDSQTTDTIEEGNTNLYWIEAPNDSEQYVRQNESWVVVDIPEGYDSNNFSTDFANQTTDDLSEGNTNLYWIEAPNDGEQYVRQDESWVVVDIPEGYDTNNFDSDFANQTTDDLTEGNTNLYYLDSRVDSHLSGANGLSYSTGVISADQDISSGSNVIFTKVSGLAMPMNGQDAATKSYVDGVAEGLQSRPSVEVITLSDLDATYDNANSGVGATLTATSNTEWPEIDGYLVTSTEFGENGVLVAGQANAAHNGRYNLIDAGSNTSPWILERCGVCDESSDIAGSFTFIKHGDQYAGTGWVQTVEDASTFVIGTDDVTVTQFSQAGVYTANSGLILDGVDFRVDANIAGDYLSYTNGVLNVQASAADSSNTLVLRDNNGDITANGFIGDGSALTNIDYDNLVNTPNSELEVLSPASTIDLDVSDSINFNITLTQNTTFTFSGLASTEGQSGLIVINQDGTGGHEFTLPSQAKTPVGGAQIDQVTDANSSSIISYIVVNTNAVFINYIGDFQ